MLNLSPGIRLGGNQLVRRLRAGESRQVFSRLDLSDARKTVVKIASLGCQTDVDRLVREFSVLREAAGPGVVAAIEHGVTLSQEMAWLVLTAGGPSLASVLASVPGQRFSLPVALAAMYSAAMSLGALHGRGWQHGDLKPGNLLCGTEGAVILSDLEFATRLSSETNGQPSAARTGGTPPFIAPELWVTDSPGPSRATDVWALGVTFYLSFFGEYPFGHENDAEIAVAISRGLPPRLAELSPPLAALFAALLVGNPADRPSNGLEAAERIASTAEQLQVDLFEATRNFGLLVAAVPKDDVPPEPTTQASRVPLAPPSSPPSARPPAPASPAPLEIRTVLNGLPRPQGVGSGESLSSAFERYGVSGSGDLASWDTRNFLDVASVAVPPPHVRGFPPPMPGRAAPLDPATQINVASPAPAAVQSEHAASSTDRLVRRAAARWYRRMNPERNFPLSVVFSGKQIRIVGGHNLGITLGTEEIVIDRSDPVLIVEPNFPGCLISPPRADVHVSEETTVCRFWITPLVQGDLSEACITVRYRGKVVETLATPTKVVTRTFAKLLAVTGIASPVISKAMTIAGYNSDAGFRRSLPYAANLLGALGPMRSSLCLAGFLVTAAVAYFYLTRPLLSDDQEPTALLQNA